MDPYWQGENVTLYYGDCIEVMAGMPADSIDAIVCDPPYDLTAGKKGGTGEASLNVNSPAGRSRISTGGGFMGKQWDATGVAFDPATWRAAMHVLKPGGHLLAFGGTRTWHRLAVAIEDAGFEIRDSIAWLYGSGFPKSLDVSKAIDRAAGAQREVIGSRATAKGNGGTGHDFLTSNSRADQVDVTAPATVAAQHWSGWGTALKPAFEPVVVARKPLAGTVAGNVLAHGTGALNIDGCRISTEEDTRRNAAGGDNGLTGSGTFKIRERRAEDKAQPAGRWPANVALDADQAATLNQQSGTLTSGAMLAGTEPKGDRNTYGKDAAAGYATAQDTYADSGGASRFFYVAKAPTAERPKQGGIAHPTVKPIDLMQWLVRLVTPPGGTVLDPFAGSGTTGEATIREGFESILIEREADYLPLIRERFQRPINYLLEFDQ